MSELNSKPNHGSPIGQVDGKDIILDGLYQIFFDDLDLKLNQLLLGVTGVGMPTYVKASLPPVPPAGAPSMIFVSDDVGGSVPAFSDGTNWRRVTDRNIIS